MEAKDTIVNDTTAIVYEHIRMGNAMDISHELEAQAEISFKAGYKEALDTVIATREYDEGKATGIKEVVDWIMENPLGFGAKTIDELNRGYSFIPIRVDKWQEKLKEWGL